MITLGAIFFTSGVNDKNEGFITIAAHGDDGTIMVGQLPPDDLRVHARAAFEAAEAADQDAAVLRCVLKLGLPEELAGLVITELRESRAE